MTTTDPWREVLAALDLDDPQTAFGVALQLDEWERAGVFGWPRPDQYGFAMTWAERIADEPENPVPLRDLAARVTQIGQDHAIRRALGWEVKPGTLAALGLSTTGEAWVLCCDGRRAAWTWRVPKFNGMIPALAGITDPDEAIAAIYAEVTGAK